MGKYIRKNKIDGEAMTLMDVATSSFGVLTRAKSLALQRRLQKSSSSSSLPTSPAPTPPSKKKQKQQMTDCGGSYLQLRSRRLQKKPPIVVIRSSKRRKQQRRKETCVRSSNTQTLDSLGGSIRESVGDGSRSTSVDESDVCGKEKELIDEINKNPCAETSFGENILQLEGNERTTRESTPCNLIRKPEINTTSGSSTELNNAISDNNNNNNNNQREENLPGSHRHLPTTPEMNEFFSVAEEEQQKQFIEKYNFDPVNEQPLPGRFERKKVND